MNRDAERPTRAELLHELHATRAHIAALTRRPRHASEMTVSRKLEQLDSELGLLERAVAAGRGLPGVHEVIRLLVAELQDLLPAATEPLRERVRDVLASVAFVVRRIRAAGASESDRPPPSHRRQALRAAASSGRLAPPSFHASHPTNVLIRALLSGSR